LRYVIIEGCPKKAGGIEIIEIKVG